MAYRHPRPTVYDPSLGTGRSDKFFKNEALNSARNINNLAKANKLQFALARRVTLSGAPAFIAVSARWPSQALRPARRGAGEKHPSYGRC